MRHVDRGERRERQVAVAAAAERSTHDEAFGDVHLRPPRSLAGREVGTGEDGVVAADPRAEGDLDDRQHGDGDQAGAQPGRQRQRPRRIALGLDRQHREQADATEEVQAHDRRIEAPRDGERAERALDADPDQRPERPARADSAAGASRRAQREGGEDGDERADGSRRVAMQHLDPGLGRRDGAGRHGGLGGGDVPARADRAGVAVAARPVGTAETGVAEARERADEDEIESEEEDEPRERLQAQRRCIAASATPEPGQRHQRQARADGQHAEQRREVDRGLCGAHRPARSQLAEARSSLSRSRFRRAGSASTGTRIIQSPRGSTR